MSREINFYNLIYHFKGPSPSINFLEFGGSKFSWIWRSNVYLLSIKTWWQNITTSRRTPKKFRSELSEVIRGSKKSQMQWDTAKNVKNLYNSRQKIIDLLSDNWRIRSAAIYKANKKLNTNIKMDTIFMNSENSKTSESHVLILKLINW